MIDACYFGDVRDGLRSFAAAGVRAQTCVTSPPYWGLRDYGTAEWEGGSAECDHMRPYHPLPNHSGEAYNGNRDGSQASTKAAYTPFRDACGKCGARRIDRQIGLEPTIGEYVQTMVEVFRLVRDVLADDATVWLNLGDSYTSGGRATRDHGQSELHPAQPKGTARAETPEGLKPKDLCGIPWRVAFALQADGWYLRQDIIWSKPNPMPESVTDRCTKAHEYLFLLSKRERYYFDADAIKEPASQGTHERRSVKMPDGWATHSGGHGSFHKDGREGWQDAQARRGRQRHKEQRELRCSDGDHAQRAQQAQRLDDRHRALRRSPLRYVPDRPSRALHRGRVARRRRSARSVHGLGHGRTGRAEPRPALDRLRIERGLHQTAKHASGAARDGIRMSLHSTASTSRDAFTLHKATGKLGAQQQQIVSFLRHRPYHAYTRSEIAEATGIKLSAVCGRVNELLTEQGVLEELPRRVCSITGSSAHPVRLADAQGALF